jgi:hypothetical protein
MGRVTKKLQKFIDSISRIEDWEVCKGQKDKVYVLKENGGYLTHVGMENDLKHLEKRGITEIERLGLGFSPTEGKWYGWSHRAIYGFEIGSKIVRGHWAYMAGNKLDFLHDCNDQVGNVYSSGDKLS